MSMTKLKLSQHLAALRAKEESKPLSARKESRESLLFWGTFADKEYLPQLKSCVGSATTWLRVDAPKTLAQVAMHCEAKGTTKVITSSLPLLELLLAWDARAKPSIQNYMGSYFTINGIKDPSLQIEIVIIPPLRQLVTTSTAKFLTTRYVSKLTKPDSWFKATPFNGFDLISASNEESAYSILSKCFLISIDIETFRENATIRCVSFTGFFTTESGSLESYSTVLPVDSDYNLAILRKWCWNLQAPKVFQNGKYDIAYLTRYNCPVYAYLYDTATFFHAWYCELPKSLGFLNAFCLREAMYWKDLAHTNDLHEYYRYNALDTWATGNALLSMLLEAPAYVFENYLQSFPLTFPCHLAEMTGIARDMDKLKAAREEQDQIIATKSASLNKILRIPSGSSFNVKSPKQMKQLLAILGCKDLKSADEKSLIQARFRHPFNARILNLVLDIRAARTLKEKYLQIGSDAKEFNDFTPKTSETNRILYSLNPHGTDTSRLASKEHHFWTGLQIQNIPRGPAVKRTIVADPNFFIAEADLEQAESRDTAYISGEERLIDSVEHSPDFHCQNASAFFGIPFDQLYDVATKKKLNTQIRDLAKNVNHGANYNMGENVLILTMGEENILKAKHLLNLPHTWSYREVASHLLGAFHNTYPGIKKVFYRGVVEEIARTGMLVHHRPEGELTWTRRCFGDPTRSKSILNSYIAHPPQSLNAQTLNKAWLKVFYTIAMNPLYSKNFKLCAQIHDSILFQYRKGHEYLCQMVADCMEIPVTIKAYDGKTRTFTVPAGIKAGKNGKAATYWSETE